MIKNKDIVCFSMSDWRTEMISNRYHILNRFQNYNRVFLFERPIIITTDFHRLGSVLQPIRQEKNLIIVSPIASIYEEYSKEIYRYYLKKIYRNFDLLDPIFWFYDFSLNYLLDDFPYSVSAYHCTEGYAYISKLYSVGNYFEKILKDEEHLVKKVDMVFAVSEFLTQMHRKNNKLTFLTANAVDYNLYSYSQEKKTERFGKCPILGFSGNLSDKIDFKLLWEIAKNFPSYQLVLIGPISSFNPYLKKLKQMKNVIFLGKQPVESLPSFLREFDVCLMPYIQDEWFVKLSQPLKLYEYMSSGKPIVSTQMNCLRALQKYIYESKTHKDFIFNIRRALKEKNFCLGEERIKIATQNTWDERFSLINSRLEEWFKKNGYR